MDKPKTLNDIIKKRGSIIEEISVCLNESDSLTSVVGKVDDIKYIVDTPYDLAKSSFVTFDPFTHKYGERKEFDPSIDVDSYNPCPHERHKVLSWRVGKYGDITAAVLIQNECSISERAAFEWLKRPDTIPAMRVPDVCKILGLSLMAVNPRMYESGIRLVGSL